MENPLYILKSYFSGRNLAKFCPKKGTAVWGSISEYQKSPPVKKPSVLWGTPISHSLWISGNFPGVGGITSNFLAANEFSCKGIFTSHSNASEPLKSLQPRVLHQGMHCQQCLQPETSVSARGSWVRSRWQLCLPLYWTPTTAGVSFFKMPCLGLYHPCNCGMDGMLYSLGLCPILHSGMDCNALAPSALPNT
jgi:hypothetical protein